MQNEVRNKVVEHFWHNAFARPCWEGENESVYALKAILIIFIKRKKASQSQLLGLNQNVSTSYCLPSTLDLKDLARNLDQSNYLCGYLLRVVSNTALREIELSEANARIIRGHFISTGHQRWIAGKSEWKKKKNMYLSLVFVKGL